MGFLIEISFVIYDEAYNEYVNNDYYPKNSERLLDKYPNLIIMRTFSKIYGLAALKDEDFVKRSYDMNLEGKKYLYEEFDKLGFEYASSETNHIFVNLGKEARLVFEELQKRGVIIRPFMEEYIRVTIGTMEQNEIFMAKLKEVLGK